MTNANPFPISNPEENGDNIIKGRQPHPVIITVPENDQTAPISVPQEDKQIDSKPIQK